MASTRFWDIRGMHGVSWKWVRSIGSIDEEEGERGFVDRLLARKESDCTSEILRGSASSRLIFTFYTDNIIFCVNILNAI